MKPLGMLTCSPRQDLCKDNEILAAPILTGGRSPMHRPAPAVTEAAFWYCEFDAVNLGVDSTCWDDTLTNREATAQVSSLHFIFQMSDAAWVKSP
jgi:hypothetical protein